MKTTEKNPADDPPARDAWVNAFVVVIQASGKLNDGKFLRAIAAQQWLEHGHEPAADAAAAWIARQPGKR
jgi:hypothetical protein